MSDCRILPEEVIDSMFIFLPVKSLLRFKCVSKHWHTLISSPKFTILRRDHVTDDRTKFSFALSSRFLFYFDVSEDPPIHLIQLPSIFDHLHVVGSINGLVCLSCRKSRMITLLNPALNQRKRIRVSTLEFRGKPDIVSLGFGYDHAKDDCKVIRVACSKKISRVQAEVYSTNLDYWKEIEVNLSFTLDKTENSLISNGMPYWTVKNTSYDIIWNDVCNEVFERFSWPRFGDIWTYQKLVKWKGSIALLVSTTTVGEFKGCVDILVYNKSEASWKKKWAYGPIGLDYWGTTFNSFIVNCSRDGVIFAAST